MYSSVMGRFLQTDPLGEWEEVELVNDITMSPSIAPSSSGCSSCVRGAGAMMPSETANMLVNDNMRKYVDGYNLYSNNFYVNKADPLGLVVRDCKGWMCSENTIGQVCSTG